MPGSFCTHRNSSSVKFIETRLRLGLEEKLFRADIRGSVYSCYYKLQSCCDKKSTLKHALVYIVWFKDIKCGFKVYIKELAKDYGLCINGYNKL